MFSVLLGISVYIVWLLWLIIRWVEPDARIEALVWLAAGVACGWYVLSH